MTIFRNADDEGTTGHDPAQLFRDRPFDFYGRVGGGGKIFFKKNSRTKF